MTKIILPEISYYLLIYLIQNVHLVFLMTGTLRKFFSPVLLGVHEALAASI